MKTKPDTNTASFWDEPEEEALADSAARCWMVRSGTHPIAGGRDLTYEEAAALWREAYHSDPTITLFKS